jgi:hypothetical protein
MKPVVLRSIALALFVVLASRAAPAPAAEPIGSDPEPRWWKGNLHTHTLWSDGDDFPEMAAEWYRERGYHFLALSDHNVLAQGQKWFTLDALRKRGGDAPLEKYRARFGPHWVETRRNPETGAEEVRLKPLSEFRALVEERGRFLMIPSEEISTSFEKLPIHLNATNAVERIPPTTGKSIVDTIEKNLQAVRDQALRTGQEMLPHVNHPNYHYAITAEDLAEAATEPFFEVFNGHPGVNTRGDRWHAPVERMWDIANTLRLTRLGVPALYGLATDDTHHYHRDGASRAGPGRGWVMVRACHLTPESLIRALRAGDFYASTGVTLADVKYTPDTRTLELTIEPQDGVTYETAFVGTPKSYDGASSDGPTTTTAEGTPRRVTRTYPDPVGKTFAKVGGTRASYTLSGDELFVRAVVTANKPPERLAYEGQFMQAWTQPVGWETKAPTER